MTIGGLGSGLDFLYDENATEVQVKKTLRVSELEPNRDQPRKQFSDEAIQTLADSIQQYGRMRIMHTLHHLYEYHLHTALHHHLKPLIHF